MLGGPLQGGGASVLPHQLAILAKQLEGKKRELAAAQILVRVSQRTHLCFLRLSSVSPRPGFRVFSTPQNAAVDVGHGKVKQEKLKTEKAQKVTSGVLALHSKSAHQLVQSHPRLP